MYGSNIIKGDATMHQETELIIPDYDPYNYYCVGTSRRPLHNWRHSVIKTSRMDTSIHRLDMYHPFRIGDSSCCSIGAIEE